jgi:hypothetical protein
MIPKLAIPSVKNKILAQIERAMLLLVAVFDKHSGGVAEW